MKLNRSQQYAIRWMVSQSVEVLQIVKELKIPKDIVNKFIDKNCKSSVENVVKTQAGPVKTKDLMIRQTASKGNNTVAIMTKEASQTSDAFQKSLSNTTNRHNNSIHKINE